jgi:glycosyltransferase involved in cell wall biosynthesis
VNKLLFSSPLQDPTGYGSAGRLYVRSLLKVGFNPLLHIPRYTNLKEITFKDLPDLDRYKYQGEQIDIFLNHITPDIAHGHNRATRNILLSVWETDKIPASSVIKCSKFDKILTASEYSKNAFINAGIKIPIAVVPHPIVEVKNFTLNHDLEKKYKDKFVFFSNFEWHLGKGYDILIKAFSKAFENNDDVILIIKTFSFDRAAKYDKRGFIKELKGDKLLPQIVLIDDIISENNLYSLYSICDAYVSTSRREAFSLTAAEAYAFGKHIIAPDKGGHREFLNEYNARLINSKLVDVPKDIELSRSIYRGQKWVECDFDATIEALKDAYNLGGPKIDPTHYLNKFSLENIGELLLEELELIG